MVDAPSPSAAVYQGYDLAALDRQYDIEATNSAFGDVLERYAVESRAAAGSCDALLDQPFGDHPLQQIDVYRPKAALRDRRMPVMLYFHGGYWRAGDKSGRAFPAPAFTRAGAIWAPVNYRLAPDASMDEIVHDTRSAVAWVYRNAPAIGADRDRIFASGGSAGGHLTGMLLAEGWHTEFGLPPDVIKGAVAASGLFDLTPFQFTSQQAFLKLDAGSVQRNSPIMHLPRNGPPLVMTWGGRETREFERQSEAYAAAYRDAGGEVSTLHLPDEDHFTLMGQMRDRESPLTQAKLRLMRLI